MVNITVAKRLLANDSIPNGTRNVTASISTAELIVSTASAVLQVSNSLWATGSVLARAAWHLIKLFFLRIPLFVVVSSSVNITLSFSSLLFGTLLMIFCTYYVLRSRFLNAYKRLQPDEDDEMILKNKKLQEDTDALFMNNPSASHKGGFSSYLDEFLSAIRIFGYLEKPVFHELTKSMKTRRLEEGEVLLVDEMLGFAIVVEGSLQIYHKIDQGKAHPSDHFENQSDSLSQSDDVEDEMSSSRDAYSLNGEKFQLLNNVKAGNPISSLVTILKLFTDRSQRPSFSDINLSMGEDPHSGLMSPYLDSTLEHQRADLNRSNRQQSTTSHNSGIDPHSSPEPIASHGDENLSGSRANSEGSPFAPSLPDIIACASSECTIAIIPSSAFRRLTSKYPRSASHIIQMVLTKLYRVTLQTAHNYLGLTREIIHTEVVLNRSARFELPYYLKEAVIQQIKERENLSSKQKTDPSKFQKLKRPKLKSDSSKAAVRPNSFLQTGGSRHVVIDSRDHLNPGDLLSNVPLSRKDFTSSKSHVSKPMYQNSGGTSARTVDTSSTGNTQKKTSSISTAEHSKSQPKSAVGSSLDIDNEDIRLRTFSAAQDETEESSWRMALIEGIFAYLGITKENILPAQEDFSMSLRRPSDISLASSFTSSHLASNSLTFLTSNRINRKRQTTEKKKTKYTEEVPRNFDFDTVKNEFADGLETKFIPKGSTPISQDHANGGLYYVVSGTIEVIWKNEEDDTEHILYCVKPGGIAGYLASLIGCKSFVTLRAKTDLYVGFLPSNVLERLCDKYFMIYLRIAETFANLLNPKILKLDYALEWIHLDSSEILFNQNDPANAIYVVLSGRLRQLQQSGKRSDFKKNKKKDQLESDHNVQVLGEFAQGESFGEVEVLTAINRLSTVVALRDAELARIPRTLFELLALEHPSIMIRVSRLVARKILQQNHGPEPTKSIDSSNGNKYDFNLLIPPSETTKGSVINSKAKGKHSMSGTNGRSYRTITILPITQGLPVEEFAAKLVGAFKQVGRSTIGLNQSTTLSHLGRHAFDGLAKLKQSGYFAELEEIYETVVYIADTPLTSSWTTTCINQADCVLLLAYATVDPDIGEYERLLVKSKSNARTEMILLHPERYVEPGLTHKWLRNRMWVHSLHHIQFSSPQFISSNDVKSSPYLNSFMDILKHGERFNKITKRTQENISRLLPDSLKVTVENFSSKYINKKQRYYTPVHTHKNDFLRLARILSGQAIGLVLGGGGARGISHLGVLKAIEEQGIPIDMIGGTSIGSFVGGLYAKDYDLVPIYGRVKKFAGRIGSLWRMLTDLTWPVTSYTTGHEFNRGIWKAFGDIRIEDFWIQYYCNSTNITESIQEIHSSGYAWRYIRASMSLAGLLPPIEDNGSMLLDGGYVDNLPVWEMKARGCNTIFAVDVGSVDDRTPMKYGDSLNGFWIVLNRWNPFSRHPNIPNMAEIQMRLGYVASVNALEKAKHTPGVIYMRPPIEDYATLDFAKFEEIYQVGAAYGHEFFQDLEESGKMPKIPGSVAAAGEQDSPYSMLQRRNSV